MAHWVYGVMSVVVISCTTASLTHIAAGMCDHASSIGSAHLSTMASYSLRGSNPQTMAHKTIALTTELRELCDMA